MQVKIMKWGNSAAVRLPTAFLAQLGVEVGDSMDVNISELEAKLKPTKQSKPAYKLADLLAEMPEGMPMVEGWDEMPSVGKESA